MLTTRRTLIATGAATALGALRLPTALAATDAAAASSAQAFILASSARIAAPGDAITVSAGAAGLMSGGLPAPPTKLVQIWWDLDPDRWWTALIGKPVSASGGRCLRLATVDVTGARAFLARYEVPRVPPGTYGVMALAFNTDNGVESYSTAHLTVAA
jgi:hypothetical protein